jgi:Papain family cysteine protease
MRCSWIFFLVYIFHVALLPVHAGAQGAIIETLDELQKVPNSPEFRGVLPARIDLTSTVPPPGDQGPTGSCTSWSATYAVGSQAGRRAGLGPSLRLSPSFTYNKVSRDALCQLGTSASMTLDMLRDVGALPLEEYVFDAGWCGRVPTDAELQRAGKYRIKGWSKFDARVIEHVKAQLARGVPVVFDMRPTPQFMQFKGDSVLDIPGVMNGGGHSMTAVGYDDARNAFRIQNSWGRGFGEGGYAWLSYDFWTRNVQVGYVVD